MENDAFSRCHPAVNFSFFLAAIVFCVTLNHPAYLLSGFLAAMCYYLLLTQGRGWKLIAGLLPLFLLLTAINPLFNTQGQHILTYVFGRPYTLDALLYGASISAVLVIMLLWFGCYNAVITGDKFTSLFGRFIPALSLVFVMVLRLVPGLLRKADQITGARRAIGKAPSDQAVSRQKLMSGLDVLSCLTSIALEGSVVTADSMRSRGYGSGRATSFQIYRLTASDRILLILITLFTAAVLACALSGAAAASYTPQFFIAPLNGRGAWGFAAYCLLLFIPTLLHIKEEIQWRILRSGI